ncbi:MAG: site-specific DNA-methyltransferase [Magnetococcales bacterium]|nr:site-specific DNA-methyltransferase [Magnetococcales bacterium]
MKNARISKKQNVQKPVSKKGCLWLLGTNRLLNGDCTDKKDVIKLMNGERAVLFATDPPYKVGYTGTNRPSGGKDWSDSYGRSWDDADVESPLYHDFINVAKEVAITSHAAWYCWHASKRQALLESVWNESGAFLHQQIIWVKSHATCGIGSRYLWNHEPCLYGWVRGNKPPKLKGISSQKTVWDFPGFTKKNRPNHPTPKPIELFTIPMLQHVPENGLCYEPFSGSGSQIIAGERTGRRVYAMEIEPQYVDVAIRRWQEETGKKAILDGDGRTFDEVQKDRGKDLI